MDRLKIRIMIADTCAGRHAKASDEPGCSVSQDIAVEVGQQHNIKGPGICDHPVEQRINDACFDLHIRILLQYLHRHIPEKAIASPQDIVLHSNGHKALESLFPALHCQLRSIPRHVSRILFRDDFEGINAAIQRVPLLMELGKNLQFRDIPLPGRI